MCFTQRLRSVPGSSWVIMLFALSFVSAASRSSSADDQFVRFSTDIRPIFAKHCVACHGGVKQASGLSFVYEENVLAGGESGQPAVVPGDVDASYLIERVTDPIRRRGCRRPSTDRLFPPRKSSG